MSTPSSRPPAITLRGATVQIGGNTLLDGIDFELQAGEQVAVIGPSGAGKTTLLRLCTAMLWPSSGSVHVLGRATDQLQGRALRELRADVGCLYQQDNLVPGLRVVHNVAMGNLGRWSLLRALWSLLFPADLRRAHAALERVELGHALWSLPGTLSGGEQQRVAVARLLVQEPKLLLCDEPVSALDPRLGREVVRLLTSFAREQGAALMVSLHSLERLRDGFDRIVALDRGRIVWVGTPAQLTRAILRQVYGAEYATLQLDELPLGSVGA